MSVYVSMGGSAVHLMQGVRADPHRISACGLHRFHGYLPDDLELSTTKAVTCKRCRKTAVHRELLKREES